jgi:hypothetical protein
MKQIATAGAALLLVPALLVCGVAVIGSGVANEAAASAAAAAACTYGDPDPDRIGVAMEQLGDPVDADRYNAHAAAARRVRVLVRGQARDLRTRAMDRAGSRARVWLPYCV